MRLSKTRGLGTLYDFVFIPMKYQLNGIQVKGRYYSTIIQQRKFSS